MALGVDPAQGVLENVELAGLIGDDHGVGEQAAGDDRADHGRLGDPPTLTGAEVEAVQVGLPRRLVGKAPEVRRRAERRSHALRHAVFDQVGQRRGVDHVVGMTGAQQVEEVQPALRWPGGEPGEAVIADVRGVLVAPGMAGAGIIDRHPGGRSPARPPGWRPSRLWKASLLAVRRVTIWPFEMRRPKPLSWASRRSTVTCPWKCCIRT